MKKLLSVCIPSYNMERYLSRNLDSFIKSDFVDLLELIVVNDGSTDNTFEIANGYKYRYPDSIIVIDKVNGHYGSCVNAALEVATAKFFRIVDADDWVDTKSLNELLQRLKEINADAIYTRYSNYYEVDGSTIINDDPAEMMWNETRDLNDIRFDKYVHMHQITYLTQFLKSINYHQTEGVCYTDTEYVFKPIVQAKNIHCMKLCLYQYYIGRDDQSMSMKVLMKNYSHLQKVLLSIVYFPRPAKSNVNYQFLFERYTKTLLGMLIDCIYFSHCRNKKWNSDFKVIYNLIKSRGIDLSSFLSFKVKGCYWVKWLLSDTYISRFKLLVLFQLINLREK